MTEVRDLGVTFDSTLTLHNHINNICRSGSLSLHQIGKIRKFITQEYAERIVHSFVSSKLDYCYGILYGLPQNQIQKLQRLQNSAARIVTRTKKSKHITPVLINLHWLRVQQRIIFKLLLNTYKALKGLAPDYLSTLLTVYKPARSLRSSAAKDLSVPKSRTTTYVIDPSHALAQNCGTNCRNAKNFRKPWSHLRVDLKHIFLKLLLTFEISSILNYFSSIIIVYF